MSAPVKTTRNRKVKVGKAARQQALADSLKAKHGTPNITPKVTAGPPTAEQIAQFKIEARDQKAAFIADCFKTGGYRKVNPADREATEVYKCGDKVYRFALDTEAAHVVHPFKVNGTFKGVGRPYARLIELDRPVERVKGTAEPKGKGKAKGEKAAPGSGKRNSETPESMEAFIAERLGKHPDLGVAALIVQFRDGGKRSFSDRNFRPVFHAYCEKHHLNGKAKVAKAVKVKGKGKGKTTAKVVKAAAKAKVVKAAAKVKAPAILRAFPKSAQVGRKGTGKGGRKGRR